MANKRLVTHVKPHIDDIAAMWLLMRFHTDFQGAELDFIAKDARKNGVLEDAKGLVYIGVGHGQFDEHKADTNDCATTLVWKWLEGEPIRLDAVKRRALEKLAHWILEEDTGRHNAESMRQFLPSALLHGYFELHGGDSAKLTQFGFEILDALLVGLEGQAQLELDWPKRLEFMTPWGKGVALETNARGLDGYAYTVGAVLVIQLIPQNGYRQFRAAASSEVDLSDAYQKVRKLEPTKEWYLHQSKRLLLSGSDVAVNQALSELSLKELVELVKSV